MLCLEISQRKIVEVNDLPPRVLVDGWSRFTSGLQESFTYSSLLVSSQSDGGCEVMWWPDVIYPKRKIIEVNDMPVSFIDGWSRL
jgi:hypothetical protein